jgi:oligopeptide transport system substrate-binding protein
MSSIRKPARWLLLLVAMSMIAVACQGDGGETASPDGTADPDGGDAPTGELVSTAIVEPESLFPTNSTESEGNAVLEALCTTLVEYDTETTEIVMGHAESVDTDDLQTYTVTLKEGWTFHNGEPVTAQSYVDSWNYAAYGPNAQQTSNFFANIQGFEEVNPPAPEPEGDETEAPAPDPTSETLSGLEVVDDNTFTVTLSEPFSQWPLTIGYEAFCAMPQEAFDDPDAFNEQPILNGPFMMDGPWDHNSAIRVVPFPDYQGDDVAQVPGFEFRIYADQATMYNDYLAGQLDILDALPPERLGTAEEEHGDLYGESFSSSYNYIGFPMYLDELSDVNLRRAFSLAIDRESITEVIFQGGRDPAGSFISPVIPGYRENACPDATYDPDRAKELFDEAGGWDGTLTLWLNQGGGHEEWMEAIANSYREIFGIQDIEFESLDFSEYLPLLDEQGMTGPFRLGWGMDYPSPQNYLEPLWASTSTPPGGSNASFFRNSEFDALVSEGNAQEELDDAIPFYQQAEDILCDQMPGAPVFYGKNQYVHSERVQNLHVDAFGNINYSEITVSE